jgi:hypothetical protein
MNTRLESAGRLHRAILTLGPNVMRRDPSSCAVTRRARGKPAARITVRTRLSKSARFPEEPVVDSLNGGRASVGGVADEDGCWILTTRTR